MAQDWYYTILGEVTGPVTFESLRELAREGQLASDAEVRTSTSSWKRVGEVPELSHPGEVEEPELGTDFDLDLLLAPSSTPTMQLSPKRKAQRAAVAAAAAGSLVQWYYQLLGQEMGPATQEEINEQIREGSLLAEDLVRGGATGTWKRLDKTPQFASLVSQMRPKAEWYCRILGQELGPMTFEELQHMVQSGALQADDDVQHGTVDPWVRADRVRGLKFTKSVKVTESTHDKSATLIPFGEAAKKREWYCKIPGRQLGPISYLDLVQAVANGSLTVEDKARRGKTGAWALVIDVPGLVSTEARAAHFAAKLEASRPKPVKPAPAPPKPVPVAEAPQPANPPEPPKPVAAAAVAPPAPIEPPVPRPAYTPPAATSGYGAGGMDSGGYGAMASASRVPAPPPRPAYQMPKKSSGPAFDFGAMLNDLKEKFDAKAIAAVAAIALVGGYFGLSALGISIGGKPGSSEFAQVKVMWEEIQRMHNTGDKDSDWAAFKSNHEAELKELLVKIQKQNPGSETPQLQTMLFVVRDYLPQMMIPKNRVYQYPVLESIMSEEKQQAGSYDPGSDD